MYRYNAGATPSGADGNASAVAAEFRAVLGVDLDDAAARAAMRALLGRVGYHSSPRSFAVKTPTAGMVLVTGPFNQSDTPRE